MSFNYNEYKDALFFIPLGGTSEIGLNCSLYHYDGKWIMVDLGLGFAEKAQLPGIDVVVPDLNMIEEFKENLLGVVLTHAHEDHIGAIQYVWGEFDCKIYANKFTATVLRAKLSEFGVEGEDNIEEFTDGKSFKVGPFEIEPVGLSHSIPDMSSLLIKTKEGNIYHTGDWKMDPNPVLGTTTRESELKKVAKQGVLALVSDSTNIFSNGTSGSEDDLRKSLIEIISDIKKGMVIVTTFASNIARIKSLSDAANASGRKVLLLGRSLNRMFKAAKVSGYLDGVDNIIEQESVKSYKREELLVVATGCQGEENAAIAKLASQEHRMLELNNKDTVIFASKIIPGNEKRIYDCMNKFASQDIKVITEHDHFVHVSGHPSRDEVKKMYEILKPRFSIPVHGEMMHIHEHSRFAKEIGVKATAIAENGMVIRITDEEVYSIGKIPVAYLAVDGQYLTPTNSRIFTERKIMRDQGVVVVSISLDKNKKVNGRPYITGPGLLDNKADIDLIRRLQNGISGIINDNKRSNISKMKSSIYSYLGKTLRVEIGKKPLLEVMIDDR